MAETCSRLSETDFTALQLPYTLSGVAHNLSEVTREEVMDTPERFASVPAETRRQTHTPEQHVDLVGASLGFLNEHKEELIMAAVCVGIVQLGAAIDGRLNAEIVDAIRQSHHWWKWFTSDHAVTLFTQDNPWLSTGISAAWGGFIGHMMRRAKHGQ